MILSNEEGQRTNFVTDNLYSALVIVSGTFIDF